MKGIVKKHLKEKGFGFIAGDNGTEYFFHFTGAPKGEFDKMVEGTLVDFEPGESKGGKGPRAEEVRRR